MMQCPHCSAPLEQGDHFCPSCGLPVNGTPPSSLQQGFVLPPVPAPSGAAVPPPASNPVPPTQNANNGKNKKIIIIIVAVVCALLIGLGAWAIVAMNQSDNTTVQTETNQAQNQSKTQKKTVDDATKKAADTCKVLPDATLERVSAKEGVLIAKLFYSAEGCGNTKYAEKNIKINMKIDGDVVASAIFDFSKKPIAFKDGEAYGSIAFTTWQYWRPIERIEGASDVEIIMQTNQKTSGKVEPDVDGALGGATLSKDDCNRYAQTALAEQLDYDSSRAYDFYSTLTDQLSSKKYGMEIEGKAWDYADICHHFIQYTNKHPRALLIWAADYPNYTQHGHAADYYVVLCGESFSDIDEAKQWCSSNGYQPADCVPVDLESDD